MGFESGDVSGRGAPDESASDESAPDDAAPDDAALREIVAADNRVRILEAVAVVVFAGGWAVAVWAAFGEEQSLGFGSSGGAPLSVKLAQMLSLGVAATMGAALLALAAVGLRAYTAWRRDQFDGRRGPAPDS